MITNQKVSGWRSIQIIEYSKHERPNSAHKSSPRSKRCTCKPITKPTKQRRCEGLNSLKIASKHWLVFRFFHNRCHHEKAFQTTIFEQRGPLTLLPAFKMIKIDETPVSLDIQAQHTLVLTFNYAQSVSDCGVIKVEPKRSPILLMITVKKRARKCIIPPASTYFTLTLKRYLPSPSQYHIRKPLRFPIPTGHQNHFATITEFPFLICCIFGRRVSSSRTKFIAEISFTLLPYICMLTI